MTEDGDLLPITLPEMVAELRRELRLRLKVYPRQVAQGNLSQRAAKRQTEVLAAILDKLESESAPGESGETHA
jgi:hypothetical protein